VLDGGPEVLRDVAMAISFWLSFGYNFGCIIASYTLFDSRGGFSGSSYPMDIADFEILKNVAMATNFGTKIGMTGCVNDSDWAIGYGGGFSGWPTKRSYCR